MEQITDIKAIQELLFGCLSHFKTICEKHRLTYYLSNGTLLGAVKYGDFIPWDDDADVLMPREDYERFMSLSDAETERYGLLCQNGKTGWKYPYAKLSDKTTVLKELEADFGAEVGISTGKLHARGPVGLDGLVTYKYRLYGSGQIVGDYASGKKQFHFRDLPV